MKTEKHVVILWLIISLLLPTLACAQYKFDNVLYGAAYYHEYCRQIDWIKISK